MAAEPSLEHKIGLLAKRPLQGHEVAALAELLGRQGVGTPEQLSHRVNTAHLIDAIRSVLHEWHGTVGFYSGSGMNSVMASGNTITRAFVPAPVCIGAGAVGMSTKFESLAPKFNPKPGYARGNARFFGADRNSTNYLVNTFPEYGYAVAFVASDVAAYIRDTIRGKILTTTDHLLVRALGNSAGALVHGLVSIRNSNESYVDPDTGIQREQWLDPDDLEGTKNKLEVLNGGLRGALKDVAKDEWQGIVGNNLPALKAAFASPTAHSIMVALLPTLPLSYAQRYGGSSSGPPKTIDWLASIGNDLGIVSLFNMRHAVRDKIEGLAPSWLYPDSRTDPATAQNDAVELGEAPAGTMNAPLRRSRSDPPGGLREPSLRQPGLHADPTPLPHEAHPSDAEPSLVQRSNSLPSSTPVAAPVGTLPDRAQSFDPTERMPDREQGSARRTRSV